jgi:hypothetical protein
MITYSLASHPFRALHYNSDVFTLGDNLASRLTNAPCYSPLIMDHSPIDFDFRCLRIGPESRG